jgi:hypothetical protein
MLSCAVMPMLTPCTAMHCAHARCRGADERCRNAAQPTTRHRCSTVRRLLPLWGACIGCGPAGGLAASSWGALGPSGHAVQSPSSECGSAPCSTTHVGGAASQCSHSVKHGQPKCYAVHGPHPASLCWLVAWLAGASPPRPWRMPCCELQEVHPYRAPFLCAAPLEASWGSFEGAEMSRAMNVTHACRMAGPQVAGRLPPMSPRACSNTGYPGLSVHYA